MGGEGGKGRGNRESGGGHKHQGRRRTKPTMKSCKAPCPWTPWDSTRAARSRHCLKVFKLRQSRNLTRIHGWDCRKAEQRHGQRTHGKQPGPHAPPRATAGVRCSQESHWPWVTDVPPSGKSTALVPDRPSPPGSAHVVLPGTRWSKSPVRRGPAREQPRKKLWSLSDQEQR